MEPHETSRSNALQRLTVLGAMVDDLYDAIAELPVADTVGWVRTAHILLDAAGPLHGGLRVVQESLTEQVDKAEGADDDATRND